MGQPLLSDSINKQLNLLVQKLFLGNRILDRIMSILSVKFVMINTEKHLHPLLAHAYPILADQISGYQGDKDCLTDYLDIPTDVSNYETPLDAFNTYLNYSKDLELLVSQSIDLCIKEGDKTTKVFLDDFLLAIQKYTSQAQLLVDRIEMYNSNLMDFDRDIENMLIIKPL